ALPIWTLVFRATSISRGQGSVLDTTYPRGAVTVARTRVTPERTSHRKDPSCAVIPSSRQSPAGSTTVICSEATSAPWPSTATNTMLPPVSAVGPIETTTRQEESVSSAATGTPHRHRANRPRARFGMLHCARSWDSLDVRKEPDGSLIPRRLLDVPSLCFRRL